MRNGQRDIDKRAAIGLTIGLISLAVITAFLGPEEGFSTTVDILFLVGGGVILLWFILARFRG